MGSSTSTSRTGFDPLRELLDLKGKVVIVTGGNNGIGRSTVKHLARCGAKVYMAARSESRAAAAIAAIQTEGLGEKGGEIVWHKLDLSDPREVKKSAQEFMAQEERLDVLVNNAALLGIVGKHQMHEGIVDSMMVNHFGSFVFTMTLLPLLKSTAAKESSPDVRIVNVSTNGHRLVPDDTRYQTEDDLNKTFSSKLLPGFWRYCYSKLPNVLFTRDLQRRLDADNCPITVIALHPGATNSISDRIPLPRVISDPVLHLILYPVDKGAYTSAFAAASPKIKDEPEKYRGKYLVPFGKLAEVSTKAQDPELAAELWAVTEKVLSERGVSV